MNFAAWERLKRLTFILDAQPKMRGPELRANDESAILFLDGGESSPALQELHQLVYDLELVDPRHFVEQLTEAPIDLIDSLDLTQTCQYITAVFRGHRFVDGLLISLTNSGYVQKLCRRAYSLTLTRDGWPTMLSVGPGGGISVGLTFRSLNGTLEGRTTGGRRRCPANSCPGWLVGVLWESGQTLHICSEGWHYDPKDKELRVVGGGEISARFVSPPPLGTPPLPREQWISRDELKLRPAWSANP